MKNLSWLMFAAAVFMTSCSATKEASKSNNDDVYYSSKDAAKEKSEVKQQHQNTQTTSPEDFSQSGQPEQNDPNRFDYNNVAPSSTTTETRTDGNGTQYVTNNYYNSDDYYDYAYSASIRRYYHPYGAGYYDPYYTNSYYYDYNPMSWGVSIYMGYSWWAPSVYFYSPTCGFGWGVSWGYPAYGGYPYYGYGYGYGGYGGCGYGYPSYGYGCYSPYAAGYNAGYWDGYYNGLYGGYYNPYYCNTYDHSGNTYWGWHGKTTSGHYLAPTHVSTANVNSTASAEPYNPKPMSQLYADALNNSNAADGVKPVKGGANLNSSVNQTSNPKTNNQMVEGSNTIGTKPNTNNSVESVHNNNVYQSKPHVVQSSNTFSNPTKGNVMDTYNNTETPKSNASDPKVYTGNQINTSSNPRVTYPNNPKDGKNQMDQPTKDNYNQGTDKPNYQTPNYNYDQPRKNDQLKNYSEPRKNDQPKNYSEPRRNDQSKNYSEPRKNDQPKNHDQPRSNPQPRNYETPKGNSPAPSSTPAPRGGKSNSNGRGGDN